MSKPRLDHLQRLVGTWTTEATHPAFRGVVVHGTAVVEWLEGRQFLIYRARTDHPQFPDSTSIIGYMDRDRVDTSGAAEDAQPRLTMHYYDSRGVFRIYEAGLDDVAWRLERRAPGFSQRFVGSFGEGFRTIAGLWQLCRDDVHWADDLQIAYRRDPAAAL